MRNMGFSSFNIRPALRYIQFAFIDLFGFFTKDVPTIFERELHYYAFKIILDFTEMHQISLDSSFL